MQSRIAILPSGPAQGSIRPPGSKSITNRALICAALAKGASTLQGALDSEDTRVMRDSLRQLGVRLQLSQAGQAIQVDGCGGRPPALQADLFVANSGTSIRFLTCLTALARGRFRLDGVPRMRQRPIADLLETLKQLGADVRSQNDDGCPPVIVQANGLPGGRAAIRGDVSSQFLSGLLMAAPYARQDCELVVQGPLVSQPYVDMTLRVMSAFGVAVQAENASCYRVPAGQSYRGIDYAIEPDASAASYFWAAAAITGGKVAVQGLGQHALQGDVRFCDCLKQMGCQVEYEEQQITVSAGPLRGIQVDMNAISDTVQTLAAVALFAQGPTTITNVAHIRHKETDRIGDLARELRKLGAAVDEHDDGLTITPGALKGTLLDTYQDHRMAMSLALVGLRLPGVVINDPQCTGKTYPNFFADLERIAVR